MLKNFMAITFALFTVPLWSQNLNLRINEIVASNQNGMMDDFFEHDDWVEIYNPPGSGITNLAGYYISDNPAHLAKWKIPADDAGVTTVLPNNFIVFWIDDDYNNTTSQGPTHNANFTLSSDGETFILTAPDSITIIDSVTYPVMAPDVSWGRSCDGCPNWQYFNNVTFESSNLEIQPNDILFINEVQTVNTSTYDDAQHEFDQWFEIYNPNTHQVNLANYYFGVNGDPLQWQMPSTNPVRSVIPAGAHMLIWCDNDVTIDVNHAPLSLSTSGGTITLTGPDGTTNIDTYSYGVIPEDQSYGRQSDGAGSSVLFSIPTPTVSNQLFIIQPANLYINEILTANQTDTIDNHGDNSDWFEIYNPTNNDINIGGYYFSDDPEVRNKWMVPTSFPDSVIVPANGWLLFWGDNDINQGVRHAGFRLKNQGEYLSMASPDGFTLADEIEWGFIAPDTSYGRITDGADEWVLFVGTTPEYSNGSGILHVENAVIASLNVYPNPAYDRIRFTESLNIRVFTMTGELVLQQNKVRDLEVNSWPSGVYILQDDSGRTARLVKN